MSTNTNMRVAQFFNGDWDPDLAAVKLAPVGHYVTRRMNVLKREQVEQRIGA